MLYLPDLMDRANLLATVSEPFLLCKSHSGHVSAFCFGCKMCTLSENNLLCRHTFLAVTMFAGLVVVHAIFWPNSQGGPGQSGPPPDQIPQWPWTSLDRIFTFDSPGFTPRYQTTFK